jgi:glucose-1-phosphate adenylyltransferase
MIEQSLAVILAGGKGARLEPLTRDRAKPAVPFGGTYRIIDFTLSNCLNSGLRKIFVLTQYKAMSLDRHINLGWKRYFSRERGEFVDVVPPQQRVDEHWYQGTADAVYQNIYSLERERPEHVIILAGDHIYKMNYRLLLQYHLEKQADFTVGVLPVACREASRQFGVLEVDPEYRILGFQEKPLEPRSLPGDPESCLASMGIYVSSTRFLCELLCRDATRMDSRHDFGGDILPILIKNHRVFAYPFLDENRKQVAYWRDVGTLDAFYEASMDLVSVDPQLNMYDQDWPLRTYIPDVPPPKFVFSGPHRCGCALDSIISSGSIISGGQVERSIISPECRVNSYSRVQDSLLFEGVEVGRHARIRRAILDKNVIVPSGAEVGFDPALDASRGFVRTAKGVTVIAKGSHFA